MGTVIATTACLHGAPAVARRRRSRAYSPAAAEEALAGHATGGKLPGNMGFFSYKKKEDFLFFVLQKIKFFTIISVM